MNPLIKYGVAVAVVLGALFGAYSHGVSTDKARSDLVIAGMVTAATTAKAAAAEKYRALEHKSAADMAVIAETHQKDIAHREATSNATIADLRAGTLSLRARFAACSGSAGRSTEGGTGASLGDGGASLDLRSADAEFLVRLADEADAVADQLRSCQAVVRADRADASGASKP